MSKGFFVKEATLRIISVDVPEMSLSGFIIIKTLHFFVGYRWRFQQSQEKELFKQSEPDTTSEGEKKKKTRKIIKYTG